MTFQAIHSQLDQEQQVQTTELRLEGLDWCADFGYGKPVAPKFANVLRPAPRRVDGAEDNGKGVAT